MQAVRHPPTEWMLLAAAVDVDSAAIGNGTWPWESVLCGRLAVGKVVSGTVN
jgi:hypothetical protein